MMSRVTALVAVLLVACVYSLTEADITIVNNFHSAVTQDIPGDAVVEVNGDSMTVDQWKDQTLAREEFGDTATSISGGKAAKCEVSGTTGIFDLPQLYGVPVPASDPYAWDVSPCKQDAKSCPGEKVYIRQLFVNKTCDPGLMDCTGKPTTILHDSKLNTYKFLFRACNKALASVNERVSIITVKCTGKGLKSTAANIPVTLTGTVYTYYFVMEGTCGSFDFGWIFVIMVLVGFFLYFLIGFLVNMFVRGLRGIEAVPNLAFWKDLPYLIKDGFFFIFRCFGRSGFQKV